MVVSFPVGPWLPVLMMSTVPLSQQSWAGQLPPVPAGQPFWASSRDVPGLVAASLATYAPSGTTAPPVEPPYTARGTPGFAAGTSNSSGPPLPVISHIIDGGHARGSGTWTIGGGDSWHGYPSGDIDGGNSGAAPLVDGGASEGTPMAVVSGGTSAGSGPDIIDGGSP